MPSFHRFSAAIRRATQRHHRWASIALTYPNLVELHSASGSLQRHQIWKNPSGGGTHFHTNTMVLIPNKENHFDWSMSDTRRLLHALYQVGDLDRSIKFYTECLGMKLLRKRDIPEERYTNAFLGYGPEDSHFVVVLAHHHGVDNYDLGSGFGHFGLYVEDVCKTMELIKLKGGTVLSEADLVKEENEVIGFVKDPDGFTFKLIQRALTPEPLCQLMLRVGDLSQSIRFYEKAFGMHLLQTCNYIEQKYTVARVGYDLEEKSTVLELTFNHGTSGYKKGNAYVQIAIGTNDVYKTADSIRKAGGKIIKEPGLYPGTNTKVMACLDPDGWKTVFVDNADFVRELD